MQKMDDYVQIMVESLQKKSELLGRIINKNTAQTQCVEGKEFDDIDWDAFNLLVAEKETLIDRINKMDEGFQTLYDRVKEQLNDDKSKYSSQIKEIQRLIGVVTDQGVQIRTAEERNRQIIEKVLSGKKTTIRKTRNSLKVANSYAQTMQGNFGEAGFISVNDKK